MLSLAALNASNHIYLKHWNHIHFNSAQLDFIISMFYKRWAFSFNTCVFTAVITFFIGSTSIYLMAAISFERFNLKTNFFVISIYRFLVKYFFQITMKQILYFIQAIKCQETPQKAYFIYYIRMSASECLLGFSTFIRLVALFIWRN